MNLENHAHRPGNTPAVRRPRAVYAGTFDPITAGHLSVVRRAVPLFDELIVLVAVNPEKKPLFSLAERLEMIREATARWPNVGCAHTTGYVVDFATDRGAAFLVRGVRDATDATYEAQLAHLNRLLAPELTSLFVPAQQDLAEVSSSALKALAQAGADVTQFCPPGIARRLAERFGDAVRTPHQR